MPDVLEADPLVLVRWRPEDVGDALDAVRASIEELRPWMPWACKVPTLDEQRAVFAEGGAAFDKGTEFQYVYREHATNALVGGGGVHRRVGPNAVEIGYWVRTDRHTRGYATAAARALTDAAFAHLADVDSIEIHMDRANLASARVPEKLGYLHIRTEERERLAPGDTGVGLVWQITRRHWSELRRTDVSAVSRRDR